VELRESQLKNSAEVLIGFFTDEKYSSRYRRDVFTIFQALEDIKVSLDTWETAGQNVAMYRSALPRWQAGVAANLDHSGAWTGSLVQPDAGDIGLLGALSEKLSALSDPLSEADHENISALVEQALLAVVDDSTLPENLRWHLAKVILHVKTCLAEFSIRGEVDLRQAVEILLANIKIAEATSDEPDRWTKVWNDFGKPVVVGLFIELGAQAAGLGALSALAAGAAG
jgi:hypothetical protein